jgi:hypothetical protein
MITIDFSCVNDHHWPVQTPAWNTNYSAKMQCMTCGEMLEAAVIDEGD